FGIGLGSFLFSHETPLFLTIEGVYFFWVSPKHNAALRGNKLLAKISEERAKANCFLSVLERLVRNTYPPRLIL
ncbi:hypothetical protein, partial [Pseudoalteromonas sp. T1lg75]|uniref:hypothetical protein n=1 Tax=Pseudoalteromonas sp. T1lg75 TaxID=2077102 RepID=UPI001F219F0A